MIRQIKQDLYEARGEFREGLGEIKSGQQKVIWWVAGMVSSLVVGGILGWVFQK
jgi:hypothetical protein